MTIYCPETRQVLGKLTLGDKEGERSAVMEMISEIGSAILPGIMSGDAGIVSPQVTANAKAAGHGYVLQIKGNSGMAYEEAGNFPWSRVVVSHTDQETGHGRTEIRTYKAIEAEFADFTELEKYTGIALVIQVERTSIKNSTGKVSQETSYYIGDDIYASLDLETRSRYIRDHWGQESYHWVKDAVLDEDNSMQRTANGSRVLSTIRSLVIKIGRAVCGSTKRFGDRFSSNPEKMVLIM